MSFMSMSLCWPLLTDEDLKSGTALWYMVGSQGHGVANNDASVGDLGAFLGKDESDLDEAKSDAAVEEHGYCIARVKVSCSCWGVGQIMGKS